MVRGSYPAFTRRANFFHTAAAHDEMGNLEVGHSPI